MQYIAVQYSRVEDGTNHALASSFITTRRVSIALAFDTTGINLWSCMSETISTVLKQYSEINGKLNSECSVALSKVAGGVDDCYGGGGGDGAVDVLVVVLIVVVVGVAGGNGGDGGVVLVVMMIMMIVVVLWWCWWW